MEERKQPNQNSNPTAPLENLPPAVNQDERSSYKVLSLAPKLKLAAASTNSQVEE